LLILFLKECWKPWGEEEDWRLYREKGHSQKDKGMSVELVQDNGGWWEFDNGLYYAFELVTRGDG